MPFDRTIPYNDLPELPPQIEIEFVAVLKNNESESCCR